MTTNSMPARFRSHCAAAGNLFERKNDQYDSAFEDSGLVGCVMEIEGIAKRLQKLVVVDLVLNRLSPDETQLADILTDLHNYANMAMLMLQDNNVVGKNLITHEKESRRDHEETP